MYFLVCIVCAQVPIYCTRNTHIENYTLTHTKFVVGAGECISFLCVCGRKRIFYLPHTQYTHRHTIHTSVTLYSCGTRRARAYVFPGVYCVCACVQVHFLFTAHTIHTCDLECACVLCVQCIVCARRKVQEERWTGDRL